MSEDWQRENIRIRRQPITRSREALVITTARSFYGGKFNEKAGLVLVDVLEPLHVAITTGSVQEVQAAIDQSLDEIRGWHREALNQCKRNGYVPASQVVKEPTPDDPSLKIFAPEEDEPVLEFD